MSKEHPQILEYTWETINPALDTMRTMFDLVRLVDAGECREITIQEDGTLQYGNACFSVWNADHRCANCTSFQSCNSGKKKERTEYYKDQRFDIQSLPVRITFPDQTIYSSSMELINFRSVSSESQDNTHTTKDQTETKEHLTTHDSMTGLLNWDGFCQKARQAMLNQPERRRLILVMNVRNFKLVNNLFDREKGNDILIEIAKILQTLCTEDSVYGRNSGDIFSACVPKDCFSEEKLNEIIEQMQRLTNSSAFQLTIHFGIYDVDNTNRPISLMYDWARMALESIRDEHGIHIAWFNEQMFQSLLHEQEIISSFRQNLKSGQFVIYLQPQVNPQEEIEGAECLVRWILPSGEMIPPFRFIGILEQSNLIATLDQYVWELAAKQLASWKGTKYGNLYLSINVSPRDFYHVDVAETIIGLCKKYDIPPEMLHVEITETAVADEAQDNIASIEKLQNNGFKVEIDDFGKGSSSLSMLKDIKADVLKIDMGFLRESENQKRGAVILQSVIDMAKHLGMEVITEGVETKEQLQKLTQLGCDMFQGYYFSKPIPVAAFESLLNE